MVILFEGEDMKSSLIDSIFQTISSHLAELLSNCKLNVILRKLIENYKNTGMNFFKVNF